MYQEQLLPITFSIIKSMPLCLVQISSIAVFLCSISSLVLVKFYKEGLKSFFRLWKGSQMQKEKTQNITGPISLVTPPC